MREDGLEKIKERKARYGLGMNRGLTGEELAAFSGNVEAAFEFCSRRATGSCFCGQTAGNITAINCTARIFTGNPFPVPARQGKRMKTVWYGTMRSGGKTNGRRRIFSWEREI